MFYLQAISLLLPYHAAQLVAAIKTESGITGQLSTGLADFPFIPVNDSLVCAADVFEVLDAYESAQSANQAYTESFINNSYPTQPFPHPSPENWYGSDSDLFGTGQLSNSLGVA